MIKKVLWASAIPAAIAVFIPGSVVLGLYLFVVPGLILAIAPTIFLYTAAFELLRSVLRQRIGTRSGIAVNAAAAALTLAIGIALPAPAAIAGRRAAAAAAREEVDPSQPVRLEGDVRLDRFGRAWSPVTGSRQNPCDALCAALLDTPGVRSVTLAGSDPSGTPASPVTYRVIPRSGAGATLMPADPGAIVDHLPEDDRGSANGPSRWKEAIAVKDALKDSITAKWSLRLSSAESLVAGASPATFDRVITIRDEPQHGMHRIGVTSIEIEGPNGQVLLRHHRVTAALIAMPLHVTPAGPMMDRGFEIGRSSFNTGPRYFEFKPVETLFRETSLARPATDEHAVVNLRESLAASASAPASGESPATAAPWLSTLDWRILSERDLDVLAKLIADPRAKGLERLYDGHASKVSPRLRRPIAIRLLEPATDDRLRSTLDSLVRNMPPGTYKQLLPEEETLLRDGALRLRSSALVARLSDQGADAVPRLLQLLEETVRVPLWAKRWRMLADIRRAFSALGSDAASALPTVERLFQLRSSPLTNSSNDADAWRVAMVRMGKPVETLTFPSHLSAEMVARDRERIRKQAEKGPER
jgi:hypothetical protein